MNEFSLICRFTGSLFYRQPNDSALLPLLALIKGQALLNYWPLQQDILLLQLQESFIENQLQQDYQTLFADEGGLVSPYRSNYVENDTEACQVFLYGLGAPINKDKWDHFGMLLLTASWIEDQYEGNKNDAQLMLFERYLLPWADTFLEKVELNSPHTFYRVLAQLTKEALASLHEELTED